MNSKQLYPCPCCGYLTLECKPPGSYDICPICFWEDTLEDYSSNLVSLRQAQRNFLKYGACDTTWLNYVRSPNSNDVRVPNWISIDALVEQKRLHLIQQITDAFNGVSLSDGISLHAARALDDYHSIEDAKKIGRRMDLDKKWQDVPQEWMIKFYDCFYFLDVKGFRYYIPAFMVWCLNDPRASDSNTLAYLLSALTNSSSPNFQMLNPAQIQAVSDFIEFVNNCINME